MLDSFHHQFLGHGVFCPKLRSMPACRKVHLDLPASVHQVVDERRIVIGRVGLPVVQAHPFLLRCKNHCSWVWPLTFERCLIFAIFHARIILFHRHIVLCGCWLIMRALISCWWRATFPVMLCGLFLVDHMIEQVDGAKIFLSIGRDLLHLERVGRPVLLNVIFDTAQWPSDQIASGIVWRLDELQSSSIDHSWECPWGQGRWDGFQLLVDLGVKIFGTRSHSPCCAYDLVLWQVAHEAFVVWRYQFNGLHDVHELVLSSIVEAQSIAGVQECLDVWPDVSNGHKIWSALILNDRHAFIRIKSE